jgi:FkbM family methyltransferase
MANAVLRARNRARVAALALLTSGRAPHGAPVTRILSGPLRGARFANPVNQVSPAYALGKFERHVTRAIDTYVQPGSVAYDVGASTGFHALHMAQRGATVYAFEPSPVDADLLDWNAQGTLRVVREAIGAALGEASFVVFDTPGVGHIVQDATTEPDDGRFITVPVTTLDCLVYERGFPTPAFLKVDVEGGEVAVLQGAARMLEAARPVLIIEVWNNTRAAVEELMAHHGYRWEDTSRSAWGADVLFLPR